MNWEIFLDESYFHLWCVRPEGDRDFNSPKSFHFIKKQDAEEFLKAVQKEYI